jgi:O-succinylbenzoic acid--CoA ligase
MSCRDWILSPAACGNPLWSFLIPGAAQAVTWLRDQGVKRGQRIGIVGANSPGFAALLQALPLAGATTVLFNHRLHERDLDRQIEAAAVADVLREFPAEFSGNAPLPDLSPLADADPALVLFSSGSEGEPKAVRLSWRAIRSSADAASQHLSLAAGQRWLACLPLDHIGGASIIYRAGRCGFHVHLLDSFDAPTANRHIDECEVTGVSVVPTMLHRLVIDRRGRTWPSSLRQILTGGGPLSPALIDACARLGVAPLQTYGMSETASQIATLLPGETAAHAGSAGRPLPGMSVKICTDDGVEVPDGHVGRIHVRGPQLFDGYENAGKLTQRRSTGDWFATGDLGSMSTGYLSVRGRRSELIVSGGEKIFPPEVESVLAQHPDVGDAAVVGIEDAEWGQHVVALLVAKGQQPPDHEFTEWLRLHLTGFKRPKQWRWVRELPRSQAGKLLRMKLSDLL